MRYIYISKDLFFIFLQLLIFGNASPYLLPVVGTISKPTTNGKDHVLCKSVCQSTILCNLLSRPFHTGKEVWWLLSAFLVVPNGQSWNEWLHFCDIRYFIGWRQHLYEVALFYWLVQNLDCQLSTTKKALSYPAVLFNWYYTQLYVHSYVPLP